MSSPEVLILGAARTPIGCFQGALSKVTAPRLGAVAIRAALQRGRVAPDAVDEVFMGNVLSAGLGQAPARQAAIHGGVRESAPATTVGKVCGSGLAAVIQGVRTLLLGETEVVVAGGMESMSNAPYLLPKARGGYRMGHGEIVDAMILDGLWDPYEGFHMGRGGEWCARAFGFTREAQDAFARGSYEKALRAQGQGAFAAEIAPVTVARGEAQPSVDTDEEPARTDLSRMAALAPVFEQGGTITAASASKISDGASALVLASAAAAARLGARPLARVVSHAGHAQQKDRFATAPVFATRKVLARAGWSTADVDLFEINEAFAVVTMACTQELQIDPAKVNVRGGAVALGHPIGASGARILTTLVHALVSLGKRRGVATLCLGGGEALALAIERV